METADYIFYFNCYRIFIIFYCIFIKFFIVFFIVFLVSIFAGWLLTLRLIALNSSNNFFLVNLLIFGIFHVQSLQMYIGYSQISIYDEMMMISNETV